MNGQRHMIKRQVLQLDVPTVHQTNQLSDQFSRVHQQRIVPLLDRLCSEFSEPDRIHRIESLNVDLGAIDVDNLEDDFVAKLTDRLSHALSQQISRLDRQSKQKGVRPKTSSQLELLERFALTGSLPWWADASQENLLEKTFRQLMNEAAIPLTRLMRTLALDKRALLRLVHHYDDGLLSDMLHTLAQSLWSSSLVHCPEQLIHALQRMPIRAPIRHNQIRHRVWWVLLRVTSLEANQHTEPSSLLQTVLVQVATELSLTYRALISSLHKAFQPMKDKRSSPLEKVVTMEHQTLEIGHIGRGQTRSEDTDTTSIQLADQLQKLAQQLKPELRSQLLTMLNRLTYDTTENSLPRQAGPLLRAIQQAIVAESVPATISRLIERLEAILDNPLLSASNKPNLLREKTRQPNQPTETVETSSQSSELGSRDHSRSTDETLLNLIDRIKKSAPQLRPSMPSQWPDVLLRLTTLIAEQRVPVQAGYWLREMLTAMEAKQASPIIEKLVKRLDASMHKTDAATSPSIDTSFSDTDEIFIDNAGLVTLWPFLGHFFGHLGLMHDKRFKDEAAMHRGVGLLQYLAAEDPYPAEFLLPLNKLLCGLELTDVFDSDEQVSATEAEECTNMLEAVIARAPILKNMSVVGYRGTFLLRKGSLTTRDGAWLLRVERATHDIVLDRFPWSLNWIKLPWMKAPLRVEW